MGFHDPDAGKPEIVERPVVTAPSDPIEPVDHHGIQVRDVSVGDPRDVSGELP